MGKTWLARRCAERSKQQQSTCLCRISDQTNPSNSRNNKKKREKGIKRTDIEEVEHNLLEEFGGEITKRKSEVIVHPNTMEVRLVARTKVIAESHTKSSLINMKVY